MNKNNIVISSESVQKLKNYTKDVKNITKTVRNVNDLNMAIKDFEHSTFETIREVSSLNLKNDFLVRSVILNIVEYLFKKI